MRGDFIVVMVTASNRQEAELIGRALVEKKLAACCNIVEPIQSIFYWEGKLNQEREVLLIIKSMRDHFDRIVSVVKQSHSYTTPEIIALPIVAGASDYLDWVKEETKTDTDKSLVV